MRGQAYVCSCGARCIGLADYEGHKLAHPQRAHEIRWIERVGVVWSGGYRGTMRDPLRNGLEVAS